MKPTKNRIYCSELGGIKMLFPSKKKADNFIHFNANEMLEETGKAPVRSYYCESCGGWHVTSNPNRAYYEEKQHIATFDLRYCQKALDEIIGKLRHAYIIRNYKDCYKYIEEAYIKLEWAEKSGCDIFEFPDALRWLEVCAGGLQKSSPRSNPKLNSSIERLDGLKKDLENAVQSYSGDYSCCKTIINEMDLEMRKAIRYGAGVRKLKKYNKICNANSSPLKIELRNIRNELYEQLVKYVRLKDFVECGNLIRQSYQNLYDSLNEGVPEDEIQSAIKRLEPFKELIENDEKKEL